MTDPLPAVANAQAILEALPDGVMVLDDRDRCIYLNPGAERLIGRAAGQARDRSVNELLVLSDNSKWPEAGERVRRSWGPVALRAQARGDGAQDSPRWLDLRVSRGTIGSVVCLRDPERGQAEAGVDLEGVVPDSLTGLASHQTFHGRLAHEAVGARDQGRPVALALLDVDRFKSYNDKLGHQAGDRLLAIVADRLRRVVGAEDLLAHLGGDEFAILMPGTDRTAAYALVERARAEVAGIEMAGEGITVSGGIADLVLAGDAAELYRLADGALYWSKAHGGDVAWIYDSEVIEELSAQERADHLERSHALVGLRALARAIDAKDPSTRRHSARVAALASRLAGARGWPPERAALLREAALIHDVGKLGVPDELLLRPGRLNAAEYEQVKQHAVLGAQIAAEVLNPEQLTWLRGHHERPDGQGYPDGLGAQDLSEGAALLAIADAFDVMTVSRLYGALKTPAQALAECRSLASQQFTLTAVEALQTVVAAPATGPPPLGDRASADACG